MELKAAIIAEARRLGFALAGFTTPEPPPHFSQFEAWLRAGRHGEMGYLASERSLQRRADPLKILPECRSILVLGVRYPAPEPVGMLEIARGAGSRKRAARGRVAAYAWGEDYHDVLPEWMQALVAFIEAQVEHPIPNRWYTDTGPVLEHDLAQRAGLGWIGKNTCLIHPRLGSYFLLGEILLGIEIEPDQPFMEDRCGTCRRCIDACPTGCILPDRTLDAKRCISYLTIELKGTIPPALRLQMGEWVFGCDVCQQVCPWNRFAHPQGAPAFSPRPGVAMPDPVMPDLVAELELTAEAFNQKYKASPLTRPRRRGYLRNVAVAMGNNEASSGDQALVRALVGALVGDPEALVRSHAAWALGQIGGDEASRALGSAAQQEHDPLVLEEIRIALGGKIGQ